MNGMPEQRETCSGPIIDGACKWCKRPPPVDAEGPTCQRELATPRPSYEIEAMAGRMEIACKSWRCPQCQTDTLMRADRMPDVLKRLDEGERLSGYCPSCGALLHVRQPPPSQIITPGNRHQRRAAGVRL